MQPGSACSRFCPFSMASAVNPRSTRANTSTQPSSSNHFRQARPGANRPRFIHNRLRPTVPGMMAFLDRLMRLGTASGLCLKHAYLDGPGNERDASGDGFLARMERMSFVSLPPVALSPRNMQQGQIVRTCSGVGKTGFRETLPHRPIGRAARRGPEDQQQTPTTAESDQG